MVHRLKMPEPIPGLNIERDDARAEQVITGSESTVVVDRRRVGRDVNDASLHIGRERRPRRHVAGPLPRIVLPSVEAELALGLRNDVELPLVLTGHGVIPQDVTRHVLDPALAVALLVGIADNNRTVDDDRWRRAGNVARPRIEPRERVIVMAQVGQQVDHASLRKSFKRNRRPEPLKMCTGLPVERVQEKAWRNHVDDQASVDIPMPDPLAVGSAHRLLPADRVRLTIAPQLLPGGRVYRQDSTSIAGCGVEHAVDVARRGFESIVLMRTKVVSAKHPSHLEVVEVTSVDLVNR